MPRRSKKKNQLIPARGQAPATGIDGEILRAELGDIAKSGETVRSRALALLMKQRETALNEAINAFESGQLGGLEMARLISSIHDEILRALYDFTTWHILRNSNPTKAERMAVCAVGGYGRGEMAPGSDLDLLFLLNDKKGSAYTESVSEYILYMLWDMGLKVGQSARTIPQNISMAKADQTILTSLLDIRFICGDEDLATELFSTFRKQVTKGKGRDFIAAKLGERDVRHEREGNSRYVIEPNVKEGKGGLRDLHVLYWIARYLDRTGTIMDAQHAEDYVRLGLLDENAVKRFERAADYLWRTRIHLHLTSKRPTDILTFDKQTIVARKMGYAAGPVEEAVEKFMREYFTNAREVGALTRIACAKLEADKSLRLPKGLDALLPTSRRNIKEEGFMLDRGRLMFSDPMEIRDKPAMIMQLFEIAGRRNLDIHPDAFSAISFRRNLIDSNFRKDPEISELFQKVLMNSRAPYATLKAMNESGVLGRYLLEFGGIVARTQFNMHHAYTVDEHTLYLVSHFHDLLSGFSEDSHPLASEIAGTLQERQIRILYMACLLHDTGKGVGDQCIEGARLARRATRRLSLEASEIESVSWLVRSHLLMSEAAQRRDISDPETIKSFVENIGSMSRLNMLFLLTVVDIQAVGPGVWNDWKAQLLRELYHVSKDYLKGKKGLEPAAKAKAEREQLLERLPSELADRVKPVLDDLGQTYWLGFDMADHVRHARFFDQILKEGLDEAVNTRLNKPQDNTELWVLTYDRPGLFSDLTYAISASGAQIMSARLHTSPSKRVLNVFYLQNSDNQAFGRVDMRKLTSLKKMIERALTGDRENLKISTGRISRRAAAIPAKPRVNIMRETSQNTIIEVEGRDRPGLLYELADCLKLADVNVLSAHIEVVGTNAIDAFYVDLPESFDEAKLRQSLMRVLTHNTNLVAA